MRASKKRLLSPAMLMAAAGLMVALAALIVALAGTAGAGPLASTSGLNKSSKKQVNKIVNQKLQSMNFIASVFPTVVSIPNGGTDTAIASCPPGSKGVGGGANFVTAGTVDTVPHGGIVEGSAPVTGGVGTRPFTSWRADFKNQSGGINIYGRAWVICLQIP